MEAVWVLAIAHMHTYKIVVGRGVLILIWEGSTNPTLCEEVRYLLFLPLV